MKLGFRDALPDERRCLCPGRPEDSRHCSPIVSMWSSSYKKAHKAGLIWHADWASIMHPQITRMFEVHELRAILAYERDDPDFLYGFIVGDTSEVVPVIYYVFVKRPYRRSGIARALFRALGVDPTKYFVYTCETSDAAPFARHARFNPLEARFPKENRRRPL